MKTNNFSTFLVQNIGFFLVLLLSNIFLQTYIFLKKYINDESEDITIYLKNLLTIALICFIIAFISYIGKNFTKILWIFFILNFIFFVLSHFTITHFDINANKSIFSNITQIQNLKELLNFGYLLKIFGFYIFHYIIFRIKTNKTLNKNVDKITLALIIIISLTLVAI